MNHNVKLDYFAVTVQNLSHSNLSEKERTTMAIVQFRLPREWLFMYYGNFQVSFHLKFWPFYMLKHTRKQNSRQKKILFLKENRASSGFTESSFSVLKILNTNLLSKKFCKNMSRVLFFKCSCTFTTACKLNAVWCQSVLFLNTLSFPRRIPRYCGWL